MYNPMTIRVAEIHTQDELQQAESLRRAQAVCQSRASWNQRLGLAVSQILITTGEKLRERYDPGSCYETL